MNSDANANTALIFIARSQNSAVAERVNLQLFLAKENCFVLEAKPGSERGFSIVGGWFFNSKVV
jgi:hypothetical protein